MIKKAKKDIKFLKHAIKYNNGKKARVWYSKRGLIGYPEGTITIYAKDYGSQLPRELRPINKTELMTDYFETDRAIITPSSKYYKEVLKQLLGNRRGRK
jgi:hypothetical protein